MSLDRSEGWPEAEVRRKSIPGLGRGKEARERLSSMGNRRSASLARMVNQSGKISRSQNGKSYKRQRRTYFILEAITSHYGFFSRGDMPANLSFRNLYIWQLCGSWTGTGRRWRHRIQGGGSWNNSGAELRWWWSIERRGEGRSWGEPQALASDRL